MSGRSFRRVLSKVRIRNAKLADIAALERRLTDAKATLRTLDRACWESLPEGASISWDPMEDHPVWSVVWDES